jgi:hypothetical protein
LTSAQRQIWVALNAGLGPAGMLMLTGATVTIDRMIRY